MGESKDISRQRLSQFLAARLRARQVKDGAHPEASHDRNELAAPRGEESSAPLRGKGHSKIG
jgi:hypothetical protein